MSTYENKFKFNNVEYRRQVAFGKPAPASTIGWTTYPGRYKEINSILPLLAPLGRWALGRSSGLLNSGPEVSHWYAISPKFQNYYDLELLSKFSF